MQTIKVSTIGLLIYLLSSVNILATPPDAFSTQSDSLSNLTNPNLNANLLNANLNQSNSSKPLVFAPDSKVTPSENPDVLKASEMFVDEVFSKTTLFLEFVKHLRISLTLNDNLQTLQSFLTSKCSLCKVKTVATEFEKRKANNLFFWVGRYPTNLTYDNGKKSIKIYITNAAESINGKVTDRSVFINGTPVYNVTFKDRRMTWDYDTDSLQPNQSKGDIVFMGVFANVYIGSKFSGTLEIKSNITGKKESYKITGFSRILTPKSKADKDKTDKNKDGFGKDKGGSDKNKGDSDKDKDGSDKNKGDSDKDKGGSDKNKGGSDKDQDGSDKDTVNPHNYHREMSVGFAKYKTKMFGDQLWTVENMLHYPSVAHIKNVHAENEDLKFYNWKGAMNAESKSGSQGICASGWHIPSDADWKKLEGHLGMSQALQNKDNAYRGRKQAEILHESDFNAKLLGFYQDDKMKKVGEEAYFVSSSSSSSTKNDKHFIARKIAPVPIDAMRFVLIKQSLPGALSIGEVEVISDGVNVALHKTVKSFTNTWSDSENNSVNIVNDTKLGFSADPSALLTGKVGVISNGVDVASHKTAKSSTGGSTWTDSENDPADIVDGTDLGFSAKSPSGNGWVLIDLGSEYIIDSIKIRDLTTGKLVKPAIGLVVFLSKNSMNTSQTLQQLRDDADINIVGITAIQFSNEKEHEFLLSRTELDLWRGDMLKTIDVSVRCLQDNTAPEIAPSTVENNIIVGRPMKPIEFINYASGGVDQWSILPSFPLPKGLVFDNQKGIISGTPTKVQSRNIYMVSASNSQGSTNVAVYITVLPVLVDSIKISGAKSVLAIGESMQLHVAISPNDATDKTLSWEVDDKLSVDQATGKITAIKDGVSTVRAIALNGTAVDEFEILVVPTIVFDNKSYKEILSKKTGRSWLDRNLGASEACKTRTDSNCYGDFYQWGRGRDGHQIAGSKTSSELASSITPNNAKFITNMPAVVTDWTTALVDHQGDNRKVAWIDKGVNDICPKGYSVPTSKELSNEGGGSTSVFNGMLPLSGYRDVDGILEEANKKGSYWTRSIDSKNHRSTALVFGADGAQYFLNEGRARGYQVRCIKDTVGPPIIKSNIDVLSASFGEEITPITFVNFGAHVTRWSIDGLPAGLKMNYTTGVISGVPTKVQPKALYTVTASNDLGTSSAVISISVKSVAVPVSSIQINHDIQRLSDTNVLEVGKVAQVSVALTPSNATIQKVSWSLNSKNATIHISKEGVTTLKGVSEGTVVLSATSLDGNNVVASLTIQVVAKVFNGKIYNTVTSPTTGRVWLDRNLDADMVCENATDPLCLGGLYQFGRFTDGHQKRSNHNLGKSLSKSITPSNDTLYGKSSSQQVDYGSGSGMAIRARFQSKLFYDWTSTDTYGFKRTDRYYSGVCPAGFSVPSKQEFIDEKIGLKTTTFNNSLKLPLTGMRKRVISIDKDIYIVETNSGRYWTRSRIASPRPEYKTVITHPWYYFGFSKSTRVHVEIGLRANSLVFNSVAGSVSFKDDLPNLGLALRCIKSEPAPTTPDWNTVWNTVWDFWKTIFGSPKT